MGKQPILHAGQKYQRKFQAFRRMQRHHLHRIRVRIRLTLAGLQYCVGEKGFERRQGLRL